jgi:hypothetical protein
MRLLTGSFACTAALGLVPALLGSGCGRTPPPTPVAIDLQRNQSASASAPIAGVVPVASKTPAASDRPGVAAIGAIEAGQAKGGAKMGGAPQATGGADGPASAPAR